jgi:DNA invertase Pin-like site-specific DNA recombinase
MQAVQQISGIIKAVTSEDEMVQIGRITYEAFENRAFRYTITPFWNIIDTLSSDVFQGIPGIAMELRKEHYYRVNKVPVFILARTPAQQDDYTGVARFQWLLESKLRASCDNLLVVSVKKNGQSAVISDRKQLKEFVNSGQYGDEAVITGLQVLGRNSGECTKMLYRLMHAGITLHSLQEKLRLTVSDYKGFLPILATMYEADLKKRRQEQREGIEQAKERGVYHGRKKLSTDEEFFRNIAIRFKNKEIPLEEALEITGFSKSTFYRRMRELL